MNRGWRRDVHRVVERAYSGGAGAPPGGLGVIFRVLDGLNASGAATGDLRHVENVSVGLHLLQQTISRTGKRSLAAIAQRSALHRETQRWMEQCPLADWA